MVYGKDFICWVIGMLFFMLALSDVTAGGLQLSTLESTKILLYGMIGVAFIISGTLFHGQEIEEISKENNVT